ncbi:MAG: hypothetical protein IT364_13360 [Candidatus Hydrogenedentes bacterium]|nr:hypothetical protein [Candidatus Hydrogenedentota bacterium]
MRTNRLTVCLLCLLAVAGGCASLGVHRSSRDDAPDTSQEDGDLLAGLARNEWDAGAVKGTMSLTVLDKHLPGWWQSLGVSGRTVGLGFHVKACDVFEIQVWGPQGYVRTIIASGEETVVDGVSYAMSPQNADEELTLLLIPSKIVLEHLFPVTRGRSRSAERVREIWDGIGVRLDERPYLSIFGPECDDPVTLGHISLEEGVLSSFLIDRRKLPVIREVSINWPVEGGHTALYEDPFFLEWGTGPYFMRRMWYRTEALGTVRSSIEWIEPVESRPDPRAQDTSIVGTIMRNGDPNPFGPRERD